MSNTALGVEHNIAAFLAYLLGWVSGFVIILIEKEDDFVRFHAMQSIVVFGALTLMSIFFGWIFFFSFMLSLTQIAAL